MSVASHNSSQRPETLIFSTLLCSQPEDLAALTEEHRTMEKTVSPFVRSSYSTVVKSAFHPCASAFSFPVAAWKPRPDQRHAGEDEEQLRGSAEGTGGASVRTGSSLKPRMFLIIKRDDPPFDNQSISPNSSALLLLLLLWGCGHICSCM